MAGTPDTLRYLWGDPNRNGSSHFGVFPGKIEQYVNLGDTAWCNANFASNQESITIENWGDWRNGWTNTDVLANLKKLLRELRKAYPHLQVNYHQDVSQVPTACPAQLRGHAQRVWDELTNEFNQPAPAPTPVPTKISYATIPAKKVILKRAANLWNFNFTDWAKAQSVGSYPAGYVIDVVAVATNAVGGKYYMTAYSYDGGKIRATNGFNTADCDDFKEPAPAPKPEDPKPTPVPPAKPGVKYTRYEQPIRVEVQKNDTRLWDFGYDTWGDIVAHPVDQFGKGHLIDIVGDAQHPLGGIYLMTAYSFGEADKTGTPHKTWGVNVADVKEAAVQPEPTPAPAPAPEPTPTPTPEPPQDGTPSTAGPGNSIDPTDGESAAAWLKRVFDFVIQLLSKFKFWG